MTEEEMELVARKVIEIEERRLTDEMAKLEADQPQREVRNLLRRVKTLEETKVSWTALLAIVLAVEIAYAVASRSDHART